MLRALNAPPCGPGAGSGGSFGPALELLAAVTGAGALALYQPSYDTNEWAPSAVRRATARPLSRDVLRQLVGDAANAIHYTGAAADPGRSALHLGDGTRGG